MIPHSRRIRFLLLALIIILLAAGLTPGLAGFVTTYALLHPPCAASATTPADFAHAYEDITLQTRAGKQIRAYFITGSNRAAIIIPPPYAGGRGTRLDEADVLARHGYGVLTFDSRRCADMGPLSLGYKETDEVGDALVYLQARSDVDEIGILGFSSAGATAVMAAARFPAIRAVIAEGGYGDFAEGAVGINDGRGSIIEQLYKKSIGITYRLITGIDIDKLSPIDVAGQIAPRPILLIYGSLERSLEGARHQQDAAGANAELWIVQGAGHGDYLQIAPEAYEQRVITFFDHALIEEAG